MTAWQLGGFIQDDIKIPQRLIINVGMRYDYYAVPRERDGRIFNRDGPFGPYRKPDSPWNAIRRTFHLVSGWPCAWMTPERRSAAEATAFSSAARICSRP